MNISTKFFLLLIMFLIKLFRYNNKKRLKKKCLVITSMIVGSKEAGGGEKYLEKIINKLSDKYEIHNLSMSKTNNFISNEKISKNIIALNGYILVIIKYLIVNNYDMVIDGTTYLPYIFGHNNYINLIHHITDLSLNHNYKKSLSFIGDKLTTYFYRLLQLNIITVSKSSKSDIIKKFKKEPIKIINPCLNLDRYKELETDKNILLYLGRIENSKSVHIFLEAYRLLNNKDFDCIVIGKGSILNDLKLKYPEIKFTGYLDEEEKIKYLQKAYLMVNPCIKEGFGIVHIEANACGIPVIASRVAGSIESIIENKTGLLFEYGNILELKEKMALLINDKKLRDTLGKNGIEHAKKYTDIDLSFFDKEYPIKNIKLSNIIYLIIALLIIFY